MNKMGKNTLFQAILVMAGMLTACGGSSQKDEKEQVKYEIQVMKPESRVYNLYIPAALHGVSEVEVFPQVSGIIREVNFKDGIMVTKGQTLFVIDQTEHKLQVQNAQANLAAAKAQMETTKLQYETNQKLAAKRIVSEYVMSTSMNAYHVAQAAVQQAQAQLAMAQTNLSYCTVKSPIRHHGRRCLSGRRHHQFGSYRLATTVHRPPAARAHRACLGEQHQCAAGTTDHRTGAERLGNGSSGQPAHPVV